MSNTQTAAKFDRQDLTGDNTDMNITRDGVLIGTLTTKGYPYIHTATLLDGRTGVAKSKAKALAAAEAK